MNPKVRKSNACWKPPVTDLGELPVALGKDNSLRVDVGDFQLQQGDYLIHRLPNDGLEPSVKRPLAVLLNTGEDEVRFEIGAAKISANSIRLTLLGDDFLNLSVLEF